MTKFLILLLSVSLVSIAYSDNGSQRSREYRPLEAKKVSIRTGARVTPSQESARTFLDFKRIGWSHFDNREWEKATDAFLSALEKDPESVEVAEALAMSLYRGGDYESAYRLGVELHRVMPSVGKMIADTVASDVRFMVSKGEYEVAQEFLVHFPVTNPSYAPAHGLVQDATTIASAVGPRGDESIEPSNDVRESFVRN